MATFKVGQRVRKIAQIPGATGGPPIGAEGVIVDGLGEGRAQEGAYGVHFPGHPSWHYTGHWSMYPYQLAPLTDPKADEFIEGLKKLAREPAPREEEAFAKVRKLLEQ